MGTARGKLGEMVLSRRNGQQIARTYVATIKNPRSEGQVNQRIKLANLVSTYRALKDSIARGFENKPENRSVYNEFVSANLANNAISLTSEEATAGVCIIAPYTVTRGTMPAISQTVIDNNTLILGLPLPVDYNISADTTIADLSTQLIRSAEWQLGDELAVVVMQQRVDNQGYPSVLVRKHAIVLSLDNTAAVADFMPAGFQIVNGETSIILGYNAGVFAVHSRTGASGKLLVSSASISLVGSGLYYENYNSEAQRANARQSYNVQSAAFLSPQSGTESDGEFPVLPTPSITAISFGNGSPLINQPVTAGEPFVLQRASNDQSFYIAGENLSVSAINFIAPRDVGRPQDGNATLTLQELVDSYHDASGTQTGGVDNRGRIYVPVDLNYLFPQGVTVGTSALPVFSAIVDARTNAVLWGSID